MVTFITGSMSVAGAASQACLRLVDTAARVAMEIAVGDVSGKRWDFASRVRVTRVLATGKPLKGPRARAALAPAWRECRMPGRERWGGMCVLWLAESEVERLGWIIWRVLLSGRL